jgi:hypothetical protein
MSKQPKGVSGRFRKKNKCFFFGFYPLFGWVSVGKKKAKKRAFERWEAISHNVPGSFVQCRTL